MNKIKKIKIWPIIFWLIIWEITALVIALEILLVSPLAVVKELFILCQTVDFWFSVLNTLVKIALGFTLGTVLGVTLACLSAKFNFVKELLKPFMFTVKSIPMASFVILALIWFSSKNLSIFISFLMVLPVIYNNTVHGISNTDKELLEMAKVFRLKKRQKLRYIYYFEVLPFFKSGLTVALGLCWKAGIAAEVIGNPNNSIGEHIFTSKLYLDTAGLFAWTLVVVVISILFEKSILFLLNRFTKTMEGRKWNGI